MQFWIQTGVPKYMKIIDSCDESVSQAIETIFPLLTEDVFLRMNGYYYPLSYKTDIAYMIEDIIDMLKSLREDQSGDMKISWATNTFACVWEMSWDVKTINLVSRWREQEIYDYDFRKIMHSIKMEKADFVREWKKLLEIVLVALNDCGYADILSDYQELKKECLIIDKYGILYR